MRLMVPALFATAAVGALAVGYAIARTGFPIESYNIASSSMAPTLVAGDYLFAAQGYYRSHKPERGDVVLHYKPGSDIVFVKRVIAMPGDRVRLEAGRLYLNGELVERRPSEHPVEPDEVQGARYVETLPNGRFYEIVERAGDEGPLDDFAEIVVEPDHYFVLGDNRDGSMDSRIPEHGTVPLALIIDKASFIFLSHDVERLGRDIQPQTSGAE